MYLRSQGFGSQGCHQSGEHLGQHPLCLAGRLSRLISLLTFNILDAVVVYTLKWWPGSCQSRRVCYACTELHTQLFWVEDAHQDTHIETDKTQMRTQTQTHTWRSSLATLAPHELDLLGLSRGGKGLIRSWLMTSTEKKKDKRSLERVTDAWRILQVTLLSGMMQ